MILVIAFLVVMADQLSKYVIKAQLIEGATVPVVKGVFHITHIRNTGAAFGLFPGSTVFLVVVSVIIITGIVAYYVHYRPTNRVIKAALGLELGGAVGNMVDRTVFGRVTDFLDIKHVWPVFNLADTAIVCGAVLLAFALVFLSPADRKPVETEVAE